MIKDIKYNGFSETPSDYSAPDGDLATVSGLVPEDDALHAVLPPSAIFTLPEGYTVCYVHSNTGFKHYIAKSGTNYYWLNKPDSYANITLQDLNIIHSFPEGVETYQVNSIGNTLQILTSNGMYYFLWKGNNGSYSILGNHMPETHISFGLQGRAAKPDETALEFSLTELDGNMLIDEFSEQYENDPIFHGLEHVFTTNAVINTFDNRVLAQVNSFISRMSIEKGKFIFPFMVRYAYRLYDETLIMHSQPVLMVTDSHVAPHCFLTSWHWDSDGNHFSIRLGAMLCDLVYKADVSSELKDWADIIKSVDIFVSAPIYTYNQAGKIKGWSTADDKGYGFGLMRIPSAGDTYYPAGDYNHYCKWNQAKMIINDFGADVQVGQAKTHYGKRGKIEIDLPRFTDEEMKNKIKNCHDFYIFKSIPIEELATQRTVLEMPSGYLSSLVNREVMSDDYDSHDAIIPKYSFTYNNRLNIARIKKKLNAPFSLSDALPFADYTYQDYNVPASITNTNCTYYIFIKQDNKEMVIEYPHFSLLSNDAFRYFYYPNPNAYKCVVKSVYNGNATFYEFPLTKHDFLYGAVYYEGWTTELNTTSAPTATDDNSVEMPNSLYTSEVNNPFLFKTAGIKTVGVSSILGIRPAVKAMSPSQFGQFKFYVFTMDGVWGFEVSPEGYLQSPQLITPDIILGEGESITQIDGSVLFASERGIMMLSGSNSTCISDAINSESPFVPFGTTADGDVLPGLRTVCGNFLTTVQPVHFRTFIQDCRLLYDYPHQRIILYSPSYTYAYVFSLKSKQWGMIQSNIQSTVPDFPTATAMIQVDDNKLAMCSYSQDPVDVDGFLTAYQGLLITRPLKLDAPDILKTIDTVIQRGQFRRGHVKSILYGSRDLFNWQLVWSSQDHYLRGFRGTPYKYFRLALLCELDKDESLFGCTIGYEQRQTGRLR